MNNVKLFFRDVNDEINYINIESNIIINKVNYNISESIFSLEFVSNSDLKNIVTNTFIDYCNLQVDDYQIYGRIYEIKVDNLDVYKNRDRIFTYQFVEEKVDIFSNLNTLKLSDIINFQLKYSSSEITNSKLRTYLQKYVWCFQDDGKNINNIDYVNSLGSKLTIDSFEKLQLLKENKAEFFKPNIFVRYIIEQMFSRLGFIVKFDLNYTDINNLLLPINSEKLTYDVGEQEQIKILEATEVNQTFTNISHYRLLTFQTEILDVQEILDYDTITIPDDGEYEIILSCETNRESGDIFQYPSFRVHVNDEVIESYTIFQNSGEVNIINTSATIIKQKYFVKNIFYTLKRQFRQGDRISFGIKAGLNVSFSFYFSRDIFLFNRRVYLNKTLKDDVKFNAIFDLNSFNTINLKNEILDMTCRDFILSYLNISKALLAYNIFEKEVLIYDDINSNLNYTDIQNNVAIDTDLITYKNNKYKKVNFKEDELLKVFGERNSTMNKFKYNKKYSQDEVGDINVEFTNYMLYDSTKQFCKIGDNYYPIFISYKDTQGAGDYNKYEDTSYPLNEQTFRKGVSKFNIPLLYYKQYDVSSVSGTGMMFGTYKLNKFNTLVQYSNINSNNYYLYYRSSDDDYINSDKVVYNYVLSELPLTNLINLEMMDNLYNRLNNIYNVENFNTKYTNVELSCNLDYSKINSNLTNFNNNFYLINKITDLNLTNKNICKLDLVYIKNLEIDYNLIPIIDEYSSDYQPIMIDCGVDDDYENMNIVIDCGVDDDYENMSDVIKSI
jgi:hypothetical protein